MRETRQDMTALADLIEQLRTSTRPSADRFVSRWDKDHGPAGTVRGWFEDNIGRRVDLLQVNADGDMPWHTMPRTVTSVTARAVELTPDGKTIPSFRNLKGTRVVARGDDYLIATTDHQHMLFVLV